MDPKERREAIGLLQQNLQRIKKQPFVSDSVKRNKAERLLDQATALYNLIVTTDLYYEQDEMADFFVRYVDLINDVMQRAEEVKK